MNRILFFFAATCWVISLAVHISTVMGIDVAGKFPYVWLLHAGVFVAFVPAMFKLKKTEELQGDVSIGNERTKFGFPAILVSTSPRWLRVVLGLCFFYAILNFAYFMFSPSGTPMHRGGQYVLTNRSTVVSIITEEEYHKLKPREVRGFSGHWLMFYAASAAILYPFKRAKTTKN